jgi:hypothetical protein
VTADLGVELKVRAELRYANEDLARDGTASAQTTVYVARHFLPAMLRREIGRRADLPKPVGEALKRVDQALRSARVERDKTTVRLSVDVNARDVLVPAL